MTQLRFKNHPAHRSFNNLVDHLFNDYPSMYRASEDFKQVTPVNVKESENGYILEVVAPGLNKEDFRIDLDKQTLTISAEKKKAEAEDKSNRNIRTEYKFQSFKRSFIVDEKIDTENISAQYVNGVLTLNLPKKVDVKAAVKQISVQ
jgi:HSP20 family protein